MLYYSINISLSSPIVRTITDDPDKLIKDTFSNRICVDTANANDKQDYNANFYVCEAMDCKMILAGLIGYKNMKDPGEMAMQFVRDLGFEPLSASFSEITASDLRTLLRKASRNDFIYDNDDIETQFNVPSESRSGRLRNREFIADEMTEEEILEKCSSTFLGADLRNEIERIFSKKNNAFIGHPVHYALISDDRDDRNTAIGILVAALNSAGRLKGRRVSIMTPTRRFGMRIKEKHTLDIDDVEAIYRSIPGGTMVLVPESLDYESETADPNMCNVDELASIILEHRRDTLTIMVFGKNNTKSLDKLKSRLGNMRIVDIREIPVSGQAAKDMLKQKAISNNISEFNSLLSEVDKNGDKSYYPADIERLFNDWLDNHLCTEFFTQYSSFEASGRIITPVAGDAFKDLQNLIGLEGAKRVVRQAIDFNRFQNRYYNDLSPMDKPARHMVFTGNPGTAKTTVARLFAQIMKDNQILTKGELIEVGRKDLVGKYVGWTARLVEEAFDKARGSVLFIDEAYSLVDDRNGMYGDEAINTIVQMMENRRDDTIVIFAGYPDKMKAFLERNPGLRSRIAFHVDFEDYDEIALMDIFHLMAQQGNLKLDFGVDSKVRSIVRQAMNLKDFGNGRFMRNIFEKARMAQASRIMAMNEKDVDKETVNTLIADDFEIPDEIRPKYMFRPIGFAS